jgi:hypothetical protein
MPKPPLPWIVGFVLFALGSCNRSGLVAVKVVDRAGQPVGDVVVVFHDPRGGLLGTATTDADGIAVGSIEEGGGVTMAEPRSGYVAS